MASYKMNWILCLSALVSWLLISTLASRAVDVKPEEGSQTQIGEFISRLNKSSESEDVETMLNDYESKGDIIYNITAETVLDQHQDQKVKIVGYTVGQLADLCKESLDNCNYARFEFVTFVALVYHTAIPPLYEYAKYCRYNKLKYYCLGKIDKVAKNLSDKISKQDRERMAPFWKALGERFTIDQVHRVENRLHGYEIIASADGHYAASVARQQLASDERKLDKDKMRDLIHSTEFRAKSICEEAPAFKYLKEADHVINMKLSQDILKVYSTILEQKHGLEISLDDEEKFLTEFKSSAETYADIYRLFLELNTGDESGIALKKKDSLDLFKFSRVAYRFCTYDCKGIYRMLYAKRSEILWNHLSEKLEKDKEQGILPDLSGGEQL